MLKPMGRTHREWVHDRPRPLFTCSQDDLRIAIQLMSEEVAYHIQLVFGI